MKHNPEKLDLCVHSLSVVHWRVCGYLFWKLPPTRKMSDIFPFEGLSSLLAFAWCSGREGTSCQIAVYGSPCLSQSASLPHSSLLFSLGNCVAAGNWQSATGWSYFPLSVPKCQWCLGLLGSWWITFSEETAACLDARDSKPGHRDWYFHYYNYICYYCYYYCYFPGLFF